jgi:hypothetical protein
VQRLERARRHAGHSHQALAGDGDECLAADGGERLHRVVGERLARRDLGARALRVHERAHVERDPRAVERDERARVQHLGTEVGHLGSLAVVELGQQARVGHGARIGGQDAGDVLPQHDARGAERAGEQCRGEIGAAAAERRDGAVGPRADEARHDGRDSTAKQRQQQRPRLAPRGGEVGRCAAVAAVRRHELRRVDAHRAPAGGVERRGDYGARGPLAPRHQRVARPRRQVRERRHGVGDLLVLAGLCVGRSHELDARRPARHERRRQLAMASAERGGDGRRRGRIARHGAPRAVEQRVGDAGERRHHDHERPAVGLDQRDGVTDGGRVGDRRSAELPHLEPRSAAAGALSSHLWSSSVACAPAGSAASRRNPGLYGQRPRLAPAGGRGSSALSCRSDAPSSGP